MKLILSRKGFDSAAGGVPSPIFPDGRLLSLPIPDARSTIAYDDIVHDGASLGPLVADLSRGRISAGQGAHLDPDLLAQSLPRRPGWRPLFGQMGQAQGHLCKQGVGPGDLFLFFGLFRRVERRGNAWCWVREAPPCHLLWGWMQVEEVVSLVDGWPAGYEWAHDHPHGQRLEAARNVLYVGRRRLAFGGMADGLPGAGVFAHETPARRLTAPGALRVSDWALPRCFYPGDGRPPLSYHADPRRWRLEADHVALKAVARGQEFVLEGEAYPEALAWAAERIRDDA